MLGIIIQARTQSKRLPNKSVRYMYKDQTLLDVVIKRLKKINPPIVVATSNKLQDKVICEIAEKNGVDWYRGKENDVLHRFIKCAEIFEFDKIIRVCADNPFIEPSNVTSLYTTLDRQEYDYIVHTINGNNVIWEGKYGFFGEYVTLDALKMVEKQTHNKRYREHVTLYIKEHLHKFNIKRIPSRYEKFINDENFKLSVDYEDEFIFARKIMKKTGMYAKPKKVIKCVKQES